MAAAGSIDARGVIVPCASCGASNRLGYGALEKSARCARCHVDLPPAGSPVEIPSAEIFDAVVRAASVPLVVDFWAPWCGPCRMVAPELEKVARAAAGRLLVVKVNTEALPELGERFGIRSIPTMAVFSGGRELSRTAGARPAADIQQFVQQAVSGGSARR